MFNINDIFNIDWNSVSVTLSMQPLPAGCKMYTITGCDHNNNYIQWLCTSYIIYTCNDIVQ